MKKTLVNGRNNYLHWLSKELQKIQGAKKRNKKSKKGGSGSAPEKEDALN